MGETVRIVYGAHEYQALERERDELAGQVRELNEELARLRRPLPARLLGALLGRG